MNSNIDGLPDPGNFLSDQLITYIGNKRKLLPFIEAAILQIKHTLGTAELSVLDGFAGSGVVSRMLKQHCTTLYSNDLETYAWIIGCCYLTNKCDVPSDVAGAIADINQRKLRTDLGIGLIEAAYAPRDDEHIQADERVFYSNHNAKIIDNMRRSIDDYPHLMPYLIAPLLHKASVHANTSGVFKGFYKNTATNRGQFGGNAKNCLTRILKEITLEPPIFSQYDCAVQMFKQDINTLVSSLPPIDVAYFDPPYNQHPYGSNYFMLNLIAEYQPTGALSKVSGIPEDWNKSAYNKQKQACDSLSLLIRDTPAKYVVISYNAEGLIDLADLERMCATHGMVEVQRQKYNVFRGSRNLAGRSQSVDELLFVIDKR